VEELPMEVTDHPTVADWTWPENNINQFNIQVTGYDDYRPLAIYVRDSGGAILAGLTAFTWGGTLRILFLWVDENWRRRGYGTRLLAVAEEEAITRRCKQVVLDTHSFQAPAFYPGRGYTACGVTLDYPVGYQQTTFQKRLGQPQPPTN